MKCKTHEKELVGLCTWCGKELCRKCIVRQDRLKLYCNECAKRIEEVPRKILPAEPRESTEVKEVNELLEADSDESKIELWY